MNEMPPEYTLEAPQVTSSALGEQIRGIAAVDARLAELALEENIYRARLVAIQTERAALESAAGRTQAARSPA